MERVRFEDDPDRACRIGQLAVPGAAYRGVPGVGRGQVEQDLHRRGLPGAVGAQEPGDAARGNGEREVVDHHLVAVTLGDTVDLKGIHGDASFRWWRWK